MPIIKNCIYCGKPFKTHDCQIKRGGGKYCSLSCTRTHKNLIDNPVNKKDVKEKISKNHANVSGKNNPMYGKKGKLAPNYKDGRSKLKGKIGRKVGLLHFEHKCSLCGEIDINKLHVHHMDRNRNNNKLTNLKIVCIKCHLTKVHVHVRNKGKYTGSIITNNNLFKKEGDA